MRAFEQLPNLTGVAAGNTVSQTIPTGLTFERIHMEYSGVTAAQLKNVRIELNGRILTQYSTLQDLIDENVYLGREVKSGFATFHFVRPEIKSSLPSDSQLTVSRFFSLGTSGLTTAQLKFDIDAAATAPVIKMWGEKSAPAAPGWLFKRRTFHFNLVNGRTEIDNLPRPTNAHIAQIVIKAAGIEGVEFLVDNVKWRDALPKALHEHILKQNGRNPRVDQHHLDFMLDGDMYSTLKLDPSIRDMRLRIDSSAGGQAEVIVYYFDDYARSSF